MGFEAAAYANSATGAWYVAHENRRQLHGLILQRISHFIAVFMIVLYHILMQICSEYKYDSQTINIWASRILLACLSCSSGVNQC